MQKIINYMYEKEMRPLELLRSFDKDGTFLISEDEFFDKLLVTCGYVMIASACLLDTDNFC